MSNRQYWNQPALSKWWLVILTNLSDTSSWSTHIASSMVAGVLSFRRGDGHDSPFAARRTKLRSMELPSAHRHCGIASEPSRQRYEDTIHQCQHIENGIVLETTPILGSWTSFIPFPSLFNITTSRGSPARRKSAIRRHKYHR